MLERLVVDEFWVAIRRLGQHRLPTFAGIDPYGDTVLRGEAVDQMVRELEGSDFARLTSAEREVMVTVLAWGLRCRADRDLRIAFSGD
ncbi:hypothetical protein MTF65_09830 [Streptomyces sp. APSN-46.1]|uniref:hypothetical protein n=1 Tax=Streptomyces sp. APSN-46.1 TaxID=2929049 RepID=UPI001FB20695|nr:hypothetical protein [Streptomyces sp. APSN-46.1]MCJ1677631.1 hypothetical protein [Streptomyces sp. APSN-46.1]